MKMDYVYTNGVIAVKEKALLKDRIYKMCECTPEDAFRLLTESGFGGGVISEGLYEYEKLVDGEEIALDKFIREYSPSEAESAYFLAYRDFHNLKALIKAEYTKTSPEKMLAPDGEVPVAKLRECVKNSDYSPLSAELAYAAKEAIASLSEGKSGAETGIIFERALFSYLKKRCAKNKTMKHLLSVKADMTNIMSAFRSLGGDVGKNFIEGGKISLKSLKKVFVKETLPPRAFAGEGYADFYCECYEAYINGLPLTEGEKVRDAYDFNYFSGRQGDLDRNEPFMYYVFRKRAEIADVRIVFVCLIAGMSQDEIKKRLRTV